MITESPQRKPAAVTEQTASVTPQKNDRTQGNHEKMKGGLENWCTTKVDKIKNNVLKDLEEVEFLGTKSKLMSKATVAAKKATR